MDQGRAGRGGARGQDVFALSAAPERRAPRGVVHPQEQAAAPLVRGSDQLGGAGRSTRVTGSRSRSPIHIRTPRAWAR